MKNISAEQVFPILEKHMLVDGFPMVVDLEKSRGAEIVDSLSGKTYLDMFSFFASLPLGFNHPSLTDAAFVAKLGKSAITKVSNSDIYTTYMAEAVDAFDRVAIPKELPYLFLIDGGTLAVENALKAAFDWKVRKNFARGCKTEKGQQVIHFKNAFHGRSGYCMSLTNTADPRKYQYFPRFTWPRISPPSMQFPQNAHNQALAAEHEKTALAEIHAAIQQNPDDIAALILEPIQAEGGDNHFRPEFFQALRKICDEHEIMLIFDEVQTGFGMTGKFWAYEHYGVTPDILCFGKKAQVCGILAGKRLDEVPHHVFAESSRINSTFGGNLVDFVRVARILDTIKNDNLLANAHEMGTYLTHGLEELQKEFSFLSNARGRGLMCALDFANGEQRNEVRKRCFDKHMVILPCGNQSLRFRPHLAVTKTDLGKALDILRDVMGTL